MDLVPSSEFIKNLDVTFEIVSSKNIDVNEFYFTAPEVKQIKVVEPVVISREDQIALTFDLPIQKNQESNHQQEMLVLNANNEIRDIQVANAIEFMPITEITQNGIVKHSLEEYMELENKLFESKKVEIVEDTTPEELKITVSQVANTNENVTTDASTQISPLEMSIEDSLKWRADERRKKMKDFNYKFHNNSSKADQLVKEPAYKRMGIDISNMPNQSNRSRTSIGLDSNNDVQLRSNNSFLHDNVD